MPVLVGLLMVLAPTAIARAQLADLSIESMDVTVDVTAAGDVEVTEELSVEFLGPDMHGIFRVVPARYALGADPEFELPEDSTPDDLLRAIRIEDLEVDSPTGAPVELEVDGPGRLSGAGAAYSIRVGDPDRTVTGGHRYHLRYRVVGAMNAPEGRPELYWNATGDRWETVIGQATVRVSGPELDGSACFVGSAGSTRPCPRNQGAESYTAERLAPGEGMTIVAAFAPDAVDVAPPLLVERFSLARAFTGSGWAWPLAALTALVGLGAVVRLAYRQGRDRVARGAVTAAGQVDRTQPDERRRGLLERPTVPVRYRPPDHLRPAQLGLIVDESVDPVDISATVVDLAVRGHLRIEEVEQQRALWLTRTDWRLRATRPAPDDEPSRWERYLLDGLFADGDEVLVSDLKGTFAEQYGKVERGLYEDARLRRWFGSRPDKARSRWLGIGVAATVAALVLTGVLVVFTTVAVAGVPLVLAGIVLAALHRWMPHRTARGHSLLIETLGFREFVETAEADRLRYAESEGLGVSGETGRETFARYLPYAVVFGCTDRWARAFADLGVATGAAVGGFYVGHGAFDAARFSSGMSDFSSSVGSGLAHVPASSGGSGFSGGGAGGGFGGGGGGGW